MLPFSLVSWLLAASIAANAVFGGLWLGARNRVAVAITERDQARGSATACSDATEDLRLLADKRQAEGRVALDKALALSKSRNKRSDQILSKPASQPGNDCASAQDRVNDWLSNRDLQ